MKNLVNQTRKEQKTRLEEFIIELKKIKSISEINNWRYSELLPRGKKMESFTSLPEAVAYLIKRKEKKVYQAIENEVKKIETVFNSGNLISVKIQIEWTKSRTWGNNPTAEAWAAWIDKDGDRCSEYFKTRSIGGCGYDKQSTAVAEVLNQIQQVLKLLYVVKNKPANIIKANRDIFGYGSGYGLLPNIEGGVGVSCYPKIFNKLGYKFETIASGKTFDAYLITKK